MLEQREEPAQDGKEQRELPGQPLDMSSNAPELQKYLENPSAVKSLITCKTSPGLSEKRFVLF